jgi:hypothetical protein
MHFSGEKIALSGPTKLANCQRLQKYVLPLIIGQ